MRAASSSRADARSFTGVSGMPSASARSSQSARGRDAEDGREARRGVGPRFAGVEAVAGVLGNPRHLAERGPELRLDRAERDPGAVRAAIGPVARALPREDPVEDAAAARPDLRERPGEERQRPGDERLVDVDAAAGPVAEEERGEGGRDGQEPRADVGHLDARQVPGGELREEARDGREVQVVSDPAPRPAPRSRSSRARRRRGRGSARRGARIRDPTGRASRDGSSRRGRPRGAPSSGAPRRPACDFRSSVTDSTPRKKARNPAPVPPTSGGVRRIGSPECGSSTLTTRAPRSTRVRARTAPGSIRETSRTTVPDERERARSRGHLPEQLAEPRHRRDVRDLHLAEEERRLRRLLPALDREVGLLRRRHDAVGEPVVPLERPAERRPR